MKLVGEVSGIKIYALGESEMVLNSDTACALGHFFEAIAPMRYDAALDAKELGASTNIQSDAIALLNKVYQDLGDRGIVKPDTYSSIIKMISVAQHRTGL